MKNNIFSYIFILFIIIIMVYAFYKVRIQNVEDSKEDNTEISSVQELEKGKEMTLAISEFDTINPIISNNKKVQNIDRLIFEPLINITEDFKLDYTLASECAKISANTYVIKLRAGVKWSDGQKFTSDDVKFTIDRLKENANTVYSENVKPIQEVDIIDNYTLRVILQKDIYNFAYYLNFPILCSNYYSGVDFWNTDKNQSPITTGRYKIAEVTNNTILLEKNNNWWNKEAKTEIEKITINLYSTVSELYNAFKMGSIDLISTTNSNYQNYVGTIGYDLAELEGREFVFLALNTNSYPLSDVNVRKAIRNCLDKNRIVENIYGNMYKTSNFPLNTSNYLIEKQEENFYNLEEKDNLLGQSNWQWRDGVWKKMENYRTHIIELNLVVRASDEIRVKVAEDIRNQLQEQGIIVNIIRAEDNTYNTYLNKVNYDMLLCSIENAIAPDLTTYFGSNNLANFNNQEVNEIMNIIGNISDENELKQKYQRLYEIYNDEVPYIGISRRRDFALKNTRLQGEIKANWYSMFYNKGEWNTIQ